MKSTARTAASPAALALTGMPPAGRPPSASGGGPQKDEKSGTVRVWPFRNGGIEPKERVVRGIVRKFGDGRHSLRWRTRRHGADRRFEKRHDDVRADVQYIPVDSRAEKIKGAFNGPVSAPDLIEYGNTDTAGYAGDGGLADVSPEFAEWPEARQVDPTATSR